MNFDKRSNLDPVAAEYFGEEIIMEDIRRTNYNSSQITTEEASFSRTDQANTFSNSNLHLTNNLEESC